jgi:hypothetical protein
LKAKTLKLLSVLAVVLLVSLFISGCQQPTPTPTPEDTPMSKSRDMAERFLRRTPTLVFDGVLASINLDTIERCVPSDTCFTFFFSFRSTHPGYGDRGGQVLEQVMTQHQVRITVEQELITRVVIDEKWDEMAQRYLPGAGP